MINLIKADLYKLSKNRGAIICLITTMLLAMASVIAVSLLTKAAQLKGEPTEELNGIIWMSQGLNGSIIIALITAIAVTGFVTSEFSYGTMKYSIARGFSRTEIYFSQLVAAVALAGGIMLSYVIISTVTASVLWGFGDLNPEVLIGTLNVIGMQLLLYIALATFLVMTSMLIKNSAGAIAFNLITLMFLARLICKTINFVVGHNFDSNVYWIIDNMLLLTSITPEMVDVFRGLLVAVGYFSISTLIGCAAFNRYEFK